MGAIRRWDSYGSGKDGACDSVPSILDELPTGLLLLSGWNVRGGGVAGARAEQMEKQLCSDFLVLGRLIRLEGSVIPGIALWYTRHIILKYLEMKARMNVTVFSKRNS